MESSLSAQQQDLFCHGFGRIVLLFDGDGAGRTATEECVKRLCRMVFVRVIDLPNGKQPAMLAEGG
jgi:DNA primase